MGELKSRITENGIDYILVGDYYIPDLKLPEEHRPIGKYGRMHREYLREVHPARLNTLTLTGELWTYLADLNEQAQKRLGTIIEQMKAAEGVTEELKSICQMEWVQRCTQAEQDNLDDVDPIAIRETLAQRGIVDGQVVNPEKLDSDPFVQQVMADAQRIAAEETPEQPTPPDLSDQPITRTGDTITIGNGEPVHEIDITVSDEEYEAIRQTIPEEKAYLANRKNVGALEISNAPTVYIRGKKYHDTTKC